jgi:hypothetical protein
MMDIWRLSPEEQMRCRAEVVNTAGISRFSDIGPMNGDGKRICYHNHFKVKRYLA